MEGPKIQNKEKMVHNKSEARGSRGVIIFIIIVLFIMSLNSQNDSNIYFKTTNDNVRYAL